MKLTVVMPVYNERRFLERAARRLLDTPAPPGVERTLLLVNDGSRDGSEEIVRGLASEPGVRALHHDRNLGKGAALATGFADALAHDADAVLVHDADLEYDPADHAAVLAPILDGRADAVIGSRFLGQTHRVLYYWHAVANRGLTTFSNMLTNLNLTDIECCTKAITAPVLRTITVLERGFGVEPELIAKISRVRLPGDEGSSATRAVRVYEVPVAYSGRTYAEGKKITWRDGAGAIVAIARHNLLR